VYRLKELAALVGGKVVGDGETRISEAAPFEAASEGAITFAASDRLIAQVESSDASAIIVPSGDYASAKALLVVDQPKVAFAKILARLTQKPFIATGISELASIGRACEIAEAVSIHPFVRLADGVSIGSGVTLHPGVSIGKGCVVGEECTLHSNVVLYPGVRLGARVTIHAGTVLGSDGFGYVFDHNHQLKIPQTGRVEVGNDVEIGANCAIDRATFGATVVEDHVKIDNLVHIAHNCRIGANTVIVGCCGISGSVEIGRNCILAGQVGIADHIRVGDNVKILARAAVFKDVPSNSTISGTPARDHREELRAQAALRRLPELRRRLRSRGDEERDR
jgi:UDP-3-O-[3-hydroxymyristoyl] glucosamine N-acyltransferase